MRDADGKLVPGAEVESLGYGKYRLLLWYNTPGKYNIYLYWAEMAVNSAFPLQAIAQYDQSVASTSKATVQPLHSRYGSFRQTHTYTLIVATMIVSITYRALFREKSEDDELSDHLRVVLRGEGLTRAITKEPAELIADGSDCRRGKVKIQSADTVQLRYGSEFNKR
jgi:hypothetical protein